jgi:hypothetical protein
MAAYHYQIKTIDGNFSTVELDGNVNEVRQELRTHGSLVGVDLAQARSTIVIPASSIIAIRLTQPAKSPERE